MNTSPTNHDVPSGTRLAPQELAPHLGGSIDGDHLLYAWRAYQELATDPKNTVRRYDANIPAANHPLLCATLIQTEPNLPLRLRVEGSLALLYHDVLEDTFAPLPKGLPDRTVEMVHRMSHEGGSAVEIATIWTQPKEVQLLELYDLTTNVMDATKMTTNHRERYALYLELLNREVSRNYPDLNISILAKGLCERILPPRQDQEELIRVSVANLVNRVATEEGVHYVGLLNRKQYEKGQKVYGAIGGAAEFTPLGLEVFQRVFEAQPQEGSDMRFTMPERYWPIAKIALSGRNPELYEVDPVREVAEELTHPEIPGMPAILTPQQLDTVSSSFITTYEQPETKTGGSARDKDGITTRRIFNVFDLEAPSAVFKSIADHPAVRILAPSEVASTEGSAMQGRTSTGEALANNIFLVEGALAAEKLAPIVEIWQGMICEVHICGKPKFRSEILTAELADGGILITFGDTKEFKDGQWSKVPADKARNSMDFPGWVGFDVIDLHGRWAISSPILEGEDFYIVPKRGS